MIHQIEVEEAFTSANIKHCFGFELIIIKLLGKGNPLEMDGRHSFWERDRAKFIHDGGSHIEDNLSELIY